MAATTAVAIGRSLLTFRSSSSYLVMYKRVFSSSSSIARPPPPPRFCRPVLATFSLSHSLGVVVPGAVCLNTIRCLVDSSGRVILRLTADHDYLPPKVHPRPPLPGRDFKHWIVFLKKACGEGLTKEQVIQLYVQTLATALGISEEEAKKKIYSVTFNVLAFGCEFIGESRWKLEGMPGVRCVIPDAYVDPENKDYGGELFVNGEIVQRSPEKQRRLEEAGG